MKALTALVATESKLFLREWLGAFFALLFPAVLVLALGSAIPGFKEPDPDLGGARGIDIYLPITLALAIATVTMVSLLNGLTTYREKGILRRLATTPVSPAKLLASQYIVNAIALVIGSVLACVSAYVAFGAKMPSSLGVLAVAFGLGSAAMGAMSLLIAAVASTARAGVALGSLVYYPMMFVAGVWTPGPVMPEAVRRVADFTPLGAASQAMQAAWAGDSVRPLHLVVMAAFTVGLGAIAVRTFRWS
jgi:ABC-2 type transport system permease protein